MNLSKIIFFTLAGFYAALFVACGPDNSEDNSTLEKSDSNYYTAASYLMHKYDTKILVDSSATFSKEYQEDILTSGTVVLDSVVKSVQRMGDKYLMNLEVACDDSVKVFAQLSCNEEIMARYIDLNHSSILVTAKIQKIDRLVDEYVSESSELGESVTLRGEKIILLGSCEDVLLKPTIYDFNEEKGRG